MLCGRIVVTAAESRGTVRTAIAPPGGGLRVSAAFGGQEYLSGAQPASEKAPCVCAGDGVRCGTLSTHPIGCLL